MTHRHSFFGLAMVVGLAATPAAAQTSALTCTNAGTTYQIGDTACIAACHGARRLARCDRVAESAIWTYVSDVCPSARFVPPPPTDASPIQTTALMTPRPGPLKLSAIAPDMSLRLAALRVGKSPGRKQ